MGSEFRVALTADFFSDGQLIYPDFDLSVLDQADGLGRFAMAERRQVIGADQLQGANGVILLNPFLSRESLSESDHLLAACRFGVDYDKVDVDACTDADVAFFITGGAVDRPVAEATVG